MRHPRLALSTLFLAFLALGTTQTIAAHETVPKDWCVDEGTTPDIVDTFQFDGQALRKLVDKCGIVDLVQSSDDWTQASAAVAFYCADKGDGAQTPMPFVSGPKGYVTPLHHEKYRLDGGVSGVCAVCIKRKR